jgi:hypothetical protein
MYLGLEKISRKQIIRIMTKSNVIVVPDDWRATCVQPESEAAAAGAEINQGP